MDMNLSELQELVIDNLACCDSWGRKESDTTEQLNWTEYYSYFLIEEADAERLKYFL